jgi:hypothetical protein
MRRRTHRQVLYVVTLCMKSAIHDTYIHTKDTYSRGKRDLL